MAPKNKLQRADAFSPQSPVQESGTVPYISASGMNTMYETGASGLSMSAFEDPVEKENQHLKGQLADLMHQLEGRTSDLAVQDGTLMVHGFQFTSTGLIPPENMNQDSWESLGHLLLRLEGSIQWLIGDWLNYADDVKWGDATRFADTFGRDPGTLHNYAFVSRSVQFSFRNENLTYTHHVAVSGLTPEQQEYALGYAAKHRLSVAKFRQWIKDQLEHADPPALPALNFPSFKSLSSELDKLAQLDPIKAKPQDHERLRATYTEMQQALKAVAHKWGFDH